MTTPTRYLTFPRMKVFASNQIGEADPTILLWLARRARDASSGCITAPTSQADLATSATNMNLSGSAAGLGRAVTQVTWTNYTNNATGVEKCQKC